jgi:hypothetical protein
LVDVDVDAAAFKEEKAEVPVPVARGDRIRTEVLGGRNEKASWGLGATIATHIVRQYNPTCCCCCCCRRLLRWENVISLDRVPIVLTSVINNSAFGNCTVGKARMNHTTVRARAT